MKTCSKCRLEKPVTEFYRNARKKDGLDTQCKACYSAKVQRRYEDPEKRAKRNASCVKSMLKRHRQSAFLSLRKNLTSNTNKLMKDLAVGKGTDYMSLKIFGADRQTVFARIDAQLTARGFKWGNHGKEWVLDHRTPLAMAQSSIELYQLCLLENCQVLTPAENRAKAIEDARLIREHEAQLV